MQTLWLCGSYSTQFMMWSSSCIITWWSMLNIQSLLRASSKPKTISQYEGSYLQRMVKFNPKELHCDSPRGACQKFEAASLSATDRTYGSARTYGPSSRTACMAAWTYCRAFPCSGCHSKLAGFFFFWPLDK